MYGTVIDKTTRETLPQANIYISDQNGNPIQSGVSFIGTASDMDGNFSLNNVSGQYVSASYVGYLTQTKPIGVNMLNFELQPDSLSLPEVQIIAKRPFDWGKYRTPAIVLCSGLILILILKRFL